MPSPSLLSEIKVASALVYPPRPTTPASWQAKNWILNLKQNSVDPGTRLSYAAKAARGIREKLVGTCLERYLGPVVILIPAPRSSVHQPRSLWPSLEICRALCTEDLGLRVLPCLERVQAVRKAASSRPENRPKASDHLRTMRVKPQLVESGRILVVDDVVTRGATLLAAVSLLKDAYPQVDVRAFSVARTIQEEVSSFFEPYEGTIQLMGDETYRNP